MSIKASDSDFSLYGMLYFAHKAFTCGWILYKLWRGIVGNKLQTIDTEANAHRQASIPIRRWFTNFKKCIMSQK